MPTESVPAAALLLIASYLLRTHGALVADGISKFTGRVATFGLPKYGKTAWLNELGWHLQEEIFADVLARDPGALIALKALIRCASILVRAPGEWCSYARQWEPGCEPPSLAVMFIVVVVRHLKGVCKRPWALLAALAIAALITAGAHLGVTQLGGNGIVGEVIVTLLPLCFEIAAFVRCVLDLRSIQKDMRLANLLLLATAADAPPGPRLTGA